MDGALEAAALGLLEGLGGPHMETPRVIHRKRTKALAGETQEREDRTGGQSGDARTTHQSQKISGVRTATTDSHL